MFLIIAADISFGQVNTLPFSSVLLAHPILVRPTLHVGHPLGVVQIPLHRLADAGLKGFGRFPAQLGFELACVNRVAAAVAGANRAAVVFDGGALRFK